MDISLRLEELVNDAGTMLLSPKEVTIRLDLISSSMFARRIRVEVHHRDQKYIWGSVDVDPPILLARGEVSEGVAYHIFGDVYPETSSEQKVLDSLRAIPKALWRYDIRPMGGIGWKFDSIRTSLTRSIERLSDGKVDRRVAAIYADLDNFKALNDQAGHDSGDTAIRTVNREMHDLCRTFGGIPFHPSGDEYYLILPVDSLLEMMDALQAMRVRIKSLVFESIAGDSINIDITMGVQLIDGLASFEAIEAALKDAEASTKALPDAGDASGVAVKRRGRISIASRQFAVGESVSMRNYLQLGAILIRRSAQSPYATFNDPRLGLMELIARRVGPEETQTLKQQINEALAWLDIAISPECIPEALLGQSHPKLLPWPAIALAVASGILQHHMRTGSQEPPSVELCVAVDSNQIEVRADRKLVWEMPLSTEQDAERVVICSPDVLSRDGALIGVQVGFSTQPVLSKMLSLPNHVFSKVVVVDDRPSSGGGLPDFWQAAVALVCQVAASKSGNCCVIGWGPDAAKSETIRRLRHQQLVDIDEITMLSSVKSARVQEIVEHIGKTVIVVDDFDQLVSSIYESGGIVWEGHELLDLPADAEIGLFKRQGIDHQTLGAVDGIRCRTAAQAYPTVIDVLRRDADRVSADEAHQELRELTSFKIVLESPLTSRLPSYLMAQKDDMDRYVKTVLLDEGGRLGSKFRMFGQFDAFRKELASCYTGQNKNKSTRRALLVVPHEAKDGACAPEGLVSVWASPRIGTGPEGAGIVDWVFNWRTVEAFIGLPYSMYGSIELASCLMDNLIADCGEIPGGLRIGTLTYVALSLHMRVDGVHPRISKLIVDSSSE